MIAETLLPRGTLQALKKRVCTSAILLPDNLPFSAQAKLNIASSLLSKGATRQNF
jgi:hypothetical protein